ncbi:MAG: hypothetical protein AB1420_03235, partial [Bacillota bacterium]
HMLKQSFSTDGELLDRQKLELFFIATGFHDLLPLALEAAESFDIPALFFDLRFTNNLFVSKERRTDRLYSLFRVVTLSVSFRVTFPVSNKETLNNGKALKEIEKLKSCH